MAKLFGNTAACTLVCGKDHTHSRRKIWACALGYHIGNCLRHLGGGSAGNKAYRVRIAPSVKNSHGSVFVPCNILIFKQKSKLFISSRHI